MTENIAQQLSFFGFNQLESDVYIDLLVNQASTGYAIGKRLGKATANVYKALDRLGAVGAVLVTENERNRQYRAVSPEELIAHLERSFQQKKAGLLDSLQSLEIQTEEDERIYELDSVTLVLEKAHDMLRRCQSIAVIDAFPKPLEQLLPTIEAAAARGVKVILQAYAPVTIANVEPTIIHMAQENLDLWKSQQLNVVIDAEESLLALLYADLSGVHQTVWSQSVYLSFLLHVGLIRENNVHQLLTMPNAPDYYDKAQAILALDERFSPTAVSGMGKMFRQYGFSDQKET